MGALTAIFSVIVAFLVYRYNRKASRRRATLDMVMKTLMDDYVQGRYKDFKEVLRKNQDTSDPFKMASLISLSSSQSAERRDMLYQLNIYELMSLGIRRKVFDEAFYKRWYHNQFMTDYEGSIGLINGLQDNKTSIFCECTALYNKWVRDGHPESSPSRIKMAWWALMKKHHLIDQAREQAKAR